MFDLFDMNGKEHLLHLCNSLLVLPVDHIRIYFQFIVPIPGLAYLYTIVHPL